MVVGDVIEHLSAEIGDFVVSLRGWEARSDSNEPKITAGDIGRVVGRADRPQGGYLVKFPDGVRQFGLVRGYFKFAAICHCGQPRPPNDYLCRKCRATHDLRVSDVRSI